VELKEIFSGWDEIAAYLGIHRRTAQQYEKARSLPIKRTPGGGPKAPVFALKDDLDHWLLGVSTQPGEGADDSRTHAGEFAAPVLTRILDLAQDTTLYRRNYILCFELTPHPRGVQARVEYQFELCNATNQRQPFVQEFTVDDADHGHVNSMSLSVNGKPLYLLKHPIQTKAVLGYASYEGPKQWIAPRTANANYFVRGSWNIQRGTSDIWYNHMILPTVGVTVKTSATANFEITKSFSRDDLVMKGEHVDIAWRKRS
jgi:hypothetical protein